MIRLELRDEPVVPVIGNVVAIDQEPGGIPLVAAVDQQGEHLSQLIAGKRAASDIRHLRLRIPRTAGDTLWEKAGIESRLQQGADEPDLFRHGGALAFPADQVVVLCRDVRAFEGRRGLADNLAKLPCYAGQFAVRAAAAVWMQSAPVAHQSVDRIVERRRRICVTDAVVTVAAGIPAQRVRREGFVRGHRPILRRVERIACQCSRWLRRPESFRRETLQLLARELQRERLRDSELAGLQVEAD